MNTMLISSGLLQNMWGEAMLCANYFLIRYIKRKQKIFHMSYGENDIHPINTCECGDV